jgi:hypothetical protein
MDFINLEMLTPRTWLMLFICIGVGYFAIKWTANLLMGLLIGVAAIGAVGWYTGLITKDHVRTATAELREKAGDALNGASDKAKAIGEKAHSTSAGGASEVNDAYKKTIDKR